MTAPILEMGNTTYVVTGWDFVERRVPDHLYASSALELNG